MSNIKIANMQYKSSTSIKYCILNSIRTNKNLYLLKEQRINNIQKHLPAKINTFNFSFETILVLSDFLIFPQSIKSKTNKDVSVCK